MMDVKPKCPMSRGGFECGNFDLEKYKTAFNDGYSAALQQCREEVGKQKIVGGYNCGPTISRDDLLAAISAVKGEIK
jgi:hypothetical protein